MLTAPGYQDLVTHIFRAGSKYLQSDVVFGVRRELVAAFERHEAEMTPGGEGSKEPFYTLQYDFVLSAV
jgi:hydroxyquinol 1,2-dioxygenase